jgi:hypothetical protein
MTRPMPVPEPAQPPAGYKLQANSGPGTGTAGHTFPMLEDLPDDLPVQIAGQCRSGNRHSHLPVMHAGQSTR